MAAKTYHVFRSDGAWAVKKEGTLAETYRTQGEAIKAARRTAKESNGGQLVIHARDGRIREHETYGMTPVQDPPRKSRLAKRIGRAVGNVALKRVQADSHSSSVSSRLKNNHVFINCPFDPGYRRILNAILFAVFDLGFVARCALEEEDTGEFRLSKIERIIEECRYGINDLSAVALDVATGLPRFNMPLELGLFRL